MFERFTERARQSVVLAQDAARSLKHNYIGTEHLLVGLLEDPDALSTKVLHSLSLTAENVRSDLERIVGPGEEVITGQIPFTPRAKKVYEMALREALSLGHNYIGTEHILLGLVRENEGVAARILLERDIDSEKVRNEVVYVLTHAKRSAAPAEPVSMADLVKSGDLMQSALSRLAEWVRTQDAPYEVHMAALEATDGIAGWTDTRRRMIGSVDRAA